MQLDTLLCSLLFAALTAKSAIAGEMEYLPTQVIPTAKTESGIEYVKTDTRDRYISRIAVEEAIAKSETNHQLIVNGSAQALSFRALAPSVLNTYVPTRSGEKLELSIVTSNPQSTDPKQYFRRAVESFVEIGIDGSFNFSDSNALRMPDLFNLIRDDYLKDKLTIQLAGFPSGFMMPERNAIIFHPGKTLEDSILEEKFMDKPVPGLPKEAKPYEGKTHISVLYSFDKGSGKKSRTLGYLVDAFTPNGDVWIKRFYGDEPGIPKIIACRPIAIRSPSAERMISRSEMDVKSGQLESYPIVVGTMSTLRYENGKYTGNKVEWLSLPPGVYIRNHGLPLDTVLPAPDQDIPLVRSLKPITQCRFHRFDEPVRILNVNWGFMRSPGGGDALIIKMP